MNVKTAEAFMRLHLPGRSGTGDSRIAKAIRVAEKDDALREAFAKQCAVDETALAAIHAISLPDMVRKRLEVIHVRPATKRFDWRGAFKQPAFLPVGIALIALGWLVTRVVMDRMQNFPGRESVERMVEINNVISPSAFEPVETSAGNLGDWLMLKGFDHYEVPPEFAAFKVVAGRVFKQEGFSIAQIATQKGEDDQMLFYIFRAADFGVTLDPPKRWRKFKQGVWVAGVRGDGPNVFMVVFKGDEDDMDKFLSSVKPRK